MPSTPEKPAVAGALHLATTRGSPRTCSRHEACRKGFRALYRRVPRLFDELRLARADGTYSRRLARSAKIDVLLIDDFATSPLTDDSRRDLLEILEDRTASARARRSSPAS